MLKYLSKVLYVLTGSRQELILLLFVFIATSLLEALGIGLIGPFLGFASQPESIHDFTITEWIYQQLNLQSGEQLIFILALGVACLFCIKACLYFLAQRYIFQFSFGRKSQLRARLLKAYLNMPYSFHLNKNTASIIKNTVIETQKFCLQTLLPLLQTISNLVLILVLLVLLAKTDLLLLVLVMLVLMPIFLLFYQLRNKIAKWGKRMSLAEQDMIRVINHGLGGIKETRVIGCEPYFEQQMEQESKQYESSAILYSLTQKSPRIVVETILIAFILLFISISQIFFQQNIQDTTSVLAVFSVAAIRLIPAVSNSLSDMGKMQNSSYALDMLCLDLKEIERQGNQFTDLNQLNKDNSSATFTARDQTMVFVERLEITGLEYCYGSTLKPAIQDISLNIKRGESIAFIGKSGAGKTTLVDVILGLLHPQAGDISVDGISIYQNLRAWQNIIGYIPQSIFLMDDTIESNIAFGVAKHLIDRAKLTKAIKAAQLEDLIEQLPQGIKTQVGERGVRLSGGQRQRIGIARAIYHEREILVLDEATAALDNETEQLVSEAIESLAGQKTLIIIAHRLSTVKNCDRLYVLEQGNVVRSGSYDRVVVNT